MSCESGLMQAELSASRPKGKQKRESQNESRR